mmetsp:Transcript_36532/g.57050  ORF Transcript_36532/g.57050 Transcript_36532/m.57050 type:complete len:90 (+) Transcript_36532:172-441(+)
MWEAKHAKRSGAEFSNIRMIGIGCHAWLQAEEGLRFDKIVQSQDLERCFSPGSCAQKVDTGLVAVVLNALDPNFRGTETVGLELEILRL